MKKVLVLILSMLLVVLTSCKDEQEIITDEKDDNQIDSYSSIRITNEEKHIEIALGDTIICSYDYVGNSIDSLFMVSTFAIYKILNPEETGNVRYIASNTSFDEVYFVAFPNNDSICISDTLNIRIYNKKYPKIILDCQSKNHEGPYYLGDELQLQVNKEYSNQSFEPFINSKLYFNNQYLGNCENPPYLFETPAANLPDNHIEFTLIDTAQRGYEFEFELSLVENPLPEISVGFKYRHNIKAGYYTSSDIVTLCAEGSDDYLVDSIEYYIDDILIESRSIKDQYFFSEELRIGTMQAGMHSCYCIAYDNRGAFAKSESKDIVVYQSFAVPDKIVDLVKTDNDKLLYAITENTLIQIRTDLDSVSSVDLPYSGATSLFYDSKTQSLYTSFSDGKLVSYHQATQTFSTELNSELDNIQDFIVDGTTGVAISNQKVTLFNVDTKEVVESDIETEKYSKIVLDAANQVVYAGGTSGVSRSMVYKIAYTNNSLNVVAAEDIGGYSTKLTLSPSQNYLMVVRANAYSFTEYDNNSLTEANVYSFGGYSYTGSYNTSGDLFYAADMDGGLQYFDTSDKILKGNIYVPLLTYEDVTHLEPSQDDSCFIMAIENRSSDITYKIIIVPVEQ